MTVQYSIALEQLDAHLVGVTLQIDQPDPAGQRLWLPNWIPGSYMIRDFSRHVVSIEAESGGEVVSLEKLDKSTWEAPADLAELTVRYRVYAWDLSVRAAHVDRTHAFLNGTSILLAVAGQEQDPLAITLSRPVHAATEGWQVATTLPVSSVDTDGFGEYRAENYDTAIDHPIEMGTFDRFTFQACGTPHEMVLTGECHYDKKRLAKDLQRICEHQIRFFGQPAPMGRYLFMVMVTESHYGGLEHRSSTALMIQREHLPIPGADGISDKYLDFLGLCSHEYFHLWNVKRIKPERFIPYDLRSESYTRLLWFFEGITSYYDDLVLVRCGLIDEARYFDLMARTITRVQRGAGRQTQSVADSSFDAWHKFYRQDENAPNAIVSYYAKGALVALCLDAILRRESKGKHSLDTLMQRLWKQWQESEQGLAEDEPEHLATELAGSDLTGFFRNALFETGDLPLSESLVTLGARLDWRRRSSRTDPGGCISQKSASTPGGENLDQSDTGSGIEQHATPWLGANLAPTPGGALVTHVLAGGAAESAGIAAGDRIIAVESLAITPDTIDLVLARYQDRKVLRVHHFRQGMLIESSLPVQVAPLDTACITADPQGNDALRAWLLPGVEQPVA